MNLSNQISKKECIIGIIGLGYVGLPLALAFSKSKFKTIGFDVDKSKIENLKKNISYISSVKNNSIQKTKKFFFPTTNYDKLKQTNIIIVCVPTPIKGSKKAPDLQYVVNVINKLKKVSLKNKLIIFECTSYPGTTEEFLIPVIKEQKLIIGKNIFLGYSPEREDPGNKKFSLEKKNITKIVSGHSKKCLYLVKKLYLNITKKIFVVSNIRTAEFTKLLENIYRSVNIGLVNELSQISDKFKINIFESIKAAETKPFGYQAFFPGPGVGGHCIPVDPHFLSWKAAQIGMKTKFIELAGSINDNRPKLVSNKIINIVKTKNYKIKKILFVGITYKKNCNDIRMSPVIDVLNFLQKKIDCEFFLYDIYTKSQKIKTSKKINYLTKKLNKKIMKDFDATIIACNHDGVDYELIRKESKIIFDLKNTYKKQHNNVVTI